MKGNCSRNPLSGNESLRKWCQGKHLPKNASAVLLTVREITVWIPQGYPSSSPDRFFQQICPLKSKAALCFLLTQMAGIFFSPVPSLCSPYSSFYFKTDNLDKVLVGAAAVMEGALKLKDEILGGSWWKMININDFLSVLPRAIFFKK